MPDDGQGLPEPAERLALALDATRALAEHARALHLTEADELLAGLLALLLAHGVTHEGTP
ncbi:hypothetical protein EAH89_29870 [Roseomonas nepalensis]|uniref:Uncharacterized protein n=1 Tax=Muricoccus nepalensis TaxID=1854500 RepID=A0A502EKX0_9PROT|nr:hypothetical protein [Roseomonas nepalensis]TPG37719.1 hypothetical protein EAH89_29870 [Roseomonas nepalensis]